MLGAVSPLVPRIASEEVLQVHPVLAGLFPEGGIRRGSVVVVTGASGSTSLVYALLAHPVEAGSWAALIGVPAVGIESAAGFGIRLDHLVLVPRPGRSWLEVTATLLDALDLVVLCPPGSTWPSSPPSLTSLRSFQGMQGSLGTPGRCRPADARRLASRARQSGSVLVVGEHWPEPPDLRLEVETEGWEGLSAGVGTLVRRRVTIRSSGRRAAARERHATAWLPGPDGALRGETMKFCKGASRRAVSPLAT